MDDWYKFLIGCCCWLSKMVDYFDRMDDGVDYIGDEDDVVVFLVILLLQ